MTIAVVVVATVGKLGIASVVVVVYVVVTIAGVVVVTVDKFVVAAVVFVVDVVAAVVVLPAVILVVVLLAYVLVGGLFQCPQILHLRDSFSLLCFEPLLPAVPMSVCKNWRPFA